ncbi:hypothetical protein QAD02_019570 [Eretmocerus hayati]|uniref:Uncharacterized protein n=1 Tax=Eretmocerus hayati TaxID=131215 RepID=A0ACC2PL19_9HYME|nr:hypothetical protein QAD02_019570 [Eretmocerus hayati]
MRSLSYTCLLLILAVNVFAELKTKRSHPVITKEDEDLFNTGDGVWFLDDNREPVQATLDTSNFLTDGIIDVEDHVYFHLYTRDSQESTLLYPNDIHSLRYSKFDASKPTKFVTHGWINSKNSDACTLVRDAFLSHGDYNVIVVDWSRITFRPYVWARTHVPDVAKYVAKMIDFLEDQGINLNYTTLAGHSLGAHVMGLAAYNAKGEVNYVVGLDPALPLFTGEGPDGRISTEDAHHVEVIHTNAGFLGYMHAIGMADFYPNGGSHQLGCVIDIGGACSHARSYEYFAESITSQTGFYGRRCRNFLEMKLGKCEGGIARMGGLRDQLPFTGTYYLTTKSKNPFAKGRD